MLFYFIRHGLPIYDPDMLTEEGKEQAEALSKRLALCGLDEVYSSSSNRAVMTAEPTCKKLGLEMTKLDWCVESLAVRFFTVKAEDGSLRWAFENERARRLFASREMLELGNNWLSHPFFDDTNYREGYKFISEHVYDFFAAQGYVFDKEKGYYKIEKENNKRVALFAHQGFSYCFLSCLLNIPLPLLLAHYDYPHSGFSVIKFDETGDWTVPKILTFGNDSHLYKEDRLLYNGTLLF